MNMKHTAFILALFIFGIAVPLGMAQDAEISLKESIGLLQAQSTDDLAINLGKGQQGYEQHCQSCHGKDGRLVNFGSFQQPMYLGTVAHENPNIVLQAIYNGSGEYMPALASAIKPQQAVQITQYVLTLPKR